MRARRALLYMPGDDRHKIEKAATLGVDCICMDMEDGVAPNRKAEARAQIAAALREVDFSHSERLVRINAVGSGLEQDDLTAVLPSPPGWSGNPQGRQRRLAEMGQQPDRRNRAPQRVAHRRHRHDRHRRIGERHRPPGPDRRRGCTPASISFWRRRPGGRYRRQAERRSLGSVLRAQRAGDPRGGVRPASDRYGLRGLSRSGGAEQRGGIRRPTGFLRKADHPPQPGRPGSGRIHPARSAHPSGPTTSSGQPGRTKAPAVEHSPWMEKWWMPPSSSRPSVFWKLPRAAGKI